MIDRQFLVVTGMRRSGTTLVMNLLNMSPEISIEENPIVLRTLEKFGVSNITMPLASRPYNIIRSQLVADGLAKNVDYRKLPPEPLSPLELFRRQLILRSAGPAISYAGVKATEIYRTTPQFLEQGVKFIYVYRDPRDVILSDKNRFPETDVMERVDTWKRLQSVYREMSHDGLFKVCFENLVTDTDAVVGELCSFLGANVSVPESFTRDNVAFSFFDNSSFGDLTKTFDEKAVERWTRVEDEDIGFVSHVLRRHLPQYGYRNVEQDLPERARYELRGLSSRASGWARSMGRKILS